MASAIIKDSASVDMEDDNDKAEEEEEEDLFEIDLEAVNSIPPPHYWESYFTATSSALLANCLLPIADVSSAVPIPSSTESNSLSLAEKVMFFSFHAPYHYSFQDQDLQLGNSNKEIRT